MVLRVCSSVSAAARRVRRMPANQMNAMHPVAKSQLPTMTRFLLSWTQASTSASVALLERLSAIPCPTTIPATQRMTARGPVTSAESRSKRLSMCVLSWSGGGEPQPPADVEDDADGCKHEQREDE